MLSLMRIIKLRRAIELLSYLVENQDHSFYHAELVKSTGISKNTVSKLLSALTKNKILTTEIKGKIKYYRVKKAHPVFKQFKIFSTVTRIWDEVKELEGVEVYLYGSVALGEDDERSDIDILILGKIEREKLTGLIKRLEKSLGRPIKPLVLTPLEYSLLAREDRALYESIERSKIRVI